VIWRELDRRPEPRMKEDRGGQDPVAIAEQLRLSEERSSLLIDAVTDYAIFMLDPNGVVSSWNPGAERLKGYRADQIVGQHFSRFYVEEEARSGKCDRELEQAVRDGRFQEEGWRVKADGSRFFANITITPIRDPRGGILGFAKVSRDLTVPRAAELERARLAAENAALQERARIQEFQERFIAVLGHDLRNPLAAIELGTSILRRSAAERETRTLDRMASSAQRMSWMISQMLDLTRSRLAGGLEVLRAPTDLAEDLRRAVDELRLAFPARELILSCPFPLPGEFDRDRMLQVFSNLIGNALHHGDPAKPVRVEARTDPHRVIISVHNVGPRIPEDLLPKLFDPFRRGERDSRVAGTAGLGLGLFISREIVLAHGGSIEVYSTVDEGTTFRVQLPIAAIDNPAMEDARP
jgi:PAS domain S-box-containing protein